MSPEEAMVCTLSLDTANNSNELVEIVNAALDTVEHHGAELIAYGQAKGGDATAEKDECADAKAASCVSERLTTSIAAICRKTASFDAVLSRVTDNGDEPIDEDMQASRPSGDGDEAVEAAAVEDQGLSESSITLEAAALLADITQQYYSQACPESILREFEAHAKLFKHSI